jgi:Flp pilus assembly protein TadG
MALVLPILMVFLSALIEGGLALNAWIRVNTAARDATRFAMDAGRPDDIASLVLNKLAGVEFGTSRTFTQTTNLDIYIISGATNSSGAITSWTVDHRYGPSPNGPKVRRSDIQTRLRSQGTTPGSNLNFTIVEVNFKYSPLTTTLLSRSVGLPMSSFAMVRQY